MNLAGAMGGAQQPSAGQQMPSQGAVEFQEKQRYCGETVPLEKPQLNDLRQQIARMNPDEISKYSDQVLERKLLYFEQPEVKKLQEQIKKLNMELKEQVDENCEEKGQLQAIWQ